MYYDLNFEIIICSKKIATVKDSVATGL